jgi:hypothetical protein
MPIRPRSGSLAWFATGNRAAFGRAGMFIAEHLTALRIAPGHHVPDRAIFPRSIHRLKYQKDGIAI